jgi:DNA-binding transcriptional MerR regulator
MGTISRLTGLSPVLLRAWERRYELLEPGRGPGGHRLYTDDDLRVLQRARELMDAGHSIGEVAALGRGAILAARGTSNPSPDDRPLDQVPDDQLDRRKVEIVRAAINLDTQALNRALDEVGAVVPFETMIERVIVPAAREIGDLWKAGKCSIASEHLASSIFIFRLRKLIESAESLSDRSADFVIAACMPGEEHHLGLLILSYFLNRDGVRVVYLGSLPFDDLRNACEASGPAALLLSVTLKSRYRKYRKDLRDLIQDVSQATPCYVGGGGTPDRDAELEKAGLRLVVNSESAHHTALRISGDLAPAKRRARRVGPKA